MIVIVPLATALLVALWLLSEASGKSPILRIPLGLLSILSVAGCVCVIYGVMTTLNYNAWYGSASQELIKASLEGFNAGQSEVVAKAWRELDSSFSPTYENDADYRELTEAAVQRIRADIAASTGAQREGSNSQSP